MLLFRLSGLLLLRCADRQLFALLFQLPPRITRFEPVGHHLGVRHWRVESPECSGALMVIENAG